MIRKLGSTLEKLAAERPVFLAFLVFMTATAVVIPLSFPFYFLYPRDFLVNILSEAHGMVFDLLIIGWFLFWLNKLAERRLNNNRYREEIEDYLGWKSPEATHRIAGNIRRLNRGGVMQELKLTEAYLKGANLAGVYLRDCDLWGAELDGANLNGGDLRRVNLAGANLESADMERILLSGSDLRGANLMDADLERGDITSADLRGAILRGADLQYAQLASSNLERANLEGANLRGVVATGANLQRTVLDGASLREANLDGADLRNSSMVGTDLGDASLRNVRLPDGQHFLELFQFAKNIQQAHLDSHVRTRLEQSFPALFDTSGPEPKNRVSEKQGIVPLPASFPSLEPIR